MYNYASFCMWRLGDARKAESLYRGALDLMPGDPELSFGLAQCLYLREKPRMIRIQKAGKDRLSCVERDSDEVDEDDDEPGATGFPVSLQSVVNEANELFEAVHRTLTKRWPCF